MNTAESILVIILASFLAIFLFVGIVLVVKITKLVEAMKEIAEKARDVVDNVESASEMLRKSAGPLALGRLFVNLADAIRKHKKGK